MALYLHAQLQLKFGSSNLSRYQDALRVIRRFFESTGMKLEIGTVTRIGPLYEAINIWRIDDYGHFDRALGNVDPTDQELVAALTILDETVVTEQMRILEDLPLT